MGRPRSALTYLTRKVLPYLTFSRVRPGSRSRYPASRRGRSPGRLHHDARPDESVRDRASALSAKEWSGPYLALRAGAWRLASQRPVKDAQLLRGALRCPSQEPVRDGYVALRGILQARSLASQLHRERAIGDRSTDTCAADHHVGRAMREDNHRPQILLGRGPAVRVADPEEADPAHTQSGHAQGSAMWGLLAKLLRPLSFHQCRQSATNCRHISVLRRLRNH